MICLNGQKLQVRAADLDFSRAVRADFAAGHRASCRKATRNLLRFTTRTIRRKSLKRALKIWVWTKNNFGARQVQSAISAAKNRGEDFEMYASSVEYTDEKRAAIARVYQNV